MKFFSEEIVVVAGVSQFLEAMGVEAGCSPPGACTPGPPPAAAFPSLQSPLPFICVQGELGLVGAASSPPSPFATPAHLSPDLLQVQLAASPKLRRRESSCSRQEHQEISPALRPIQVVW